MSYVGTPFTHDILVSHSEDAAATGTPLKEWSVGFSGELESELRFHPQFAKALRILTDEGYRSSQPTDPSVDLPRDFAKAIGESAVLLVLMSPAYLRSRWCTQVRECWLQRQRELGVPIEGRIAVVRILPTEEPWPDGFVDERGQELVGFRFYDALDRTTLRPFGWPRPNAQSRDPFRREVVALAGRLFMKFNELRAQLDLNVERGTDARKLLSDRLAWIDRMSAGQSETGPRTEPPVLELSPAALEKKRQSDLFLSYAHEDKERARSFAQAFEVTGWTVFWDRRILPGVSWEDEIEEEISKCRCVVVLWSTQSIRSRWVRNEATFADERQVLVPVAIEQVNVPLRFLHLQTAQLHSWDGNVKDEAFCNLVEGITRLAPRRTPPRF